MSWDLVRIALPNGAAVLALALAPILAMALGATLGKDAMHRQTALQSPALLANVDIAQSSVGIVQPHAGDAGLPF
jgi:hypothetical protein